MHAGARAVRRPAMTAPADRHRDPSLMARVARVAEEVLGRHQVEFVAARRAGGWSNATWVADGLVVRVAVAPGSAELLREARLAPLLPAETGYPEVLDFGVTGGHAWMLTREIPGRNLAAAWPTLSWDARTAAARQLWTLAEAVHRVDPAAAAGHARPSSPFYPCTHHQALADLDQLAAAGLLSSRQAGVLSGALDRFWRALPGAPLVLNHGDLCIDNALWDGSRVVALLDFEYAVMAPVELDLNELLKIAYAPPSPSAALPGPGGRGRRDLQEAVTEIAVSTPGTSNRADLLIGYSVQLEIWLRNNELAKKERQSPIRNLKCYQLLSALAGGSGGYLQPVLAKL